jgi:hypothetical protein
MIKYDLNKEEFITQSNWEIYFESDDSEIDSVIQNLSDIHDKLEMYKAILEKYYPCQLEYHYNITFDNAWDFENEYGYDNGAYNYLSRIYLTCKVDKIEIKNSVGQKHNIHDLFVALNFNVNEDKYFVMNGGLWGFKSTFTYAETHYGYIHSHLSSSTNNAIAEYSNFCLGEGSMSTLMSTLQGNFLLNDNQDEEKEYFELFCNHLHEYLSWESLAGVPHIKMRELGLAHNGKKAKKSFGNFSKQTDKYIYETFLKYYPQLYSRLIFENGVYTDIVLPKDKEFWLKYIRSCGWRAFTSNNNVYSITDDGLMENIEPVNNACSRFKIHNYYDYHFKGERIIGKIIPDDVIVMEKIISPLKVFLIKKQILNYLNNEQ